MSMQILTKISKPEILELQKKSLQNLEDFGDFVNFCKNYNHDIPKEILDRKKEAVKEFLERMLN